MQSQKTRVFKPRQPKNDQANITREPDGRSFRVSVRIKGSDGGMFERQARRLPNEEAARARRAIFFHEYNMEQGGSLEYARQYAAVNGLDLAAFGMAEPEPEPEPRGMTLKEWGDQCIDVHWPRSVPVTAPDYKTAMNKHVFPRLGTVLLSDLSPSMIREAFYQMAEQPSKVKHGEKEVEIMLSVNTIKAVKTAVGSCLSLAVDHGLIPLNPANGLKMRWEGMAQTKKRDSDDTEDDGQIRLMTQKEIDGLIARSLGTPIYSMVLLQAKLGLRISEALAVRAQDFDLTRKVLKVRRQLDRVANGDGSKLKLVELKTKASRRDIPLPASVLKFVRSWKGAPDAPMTANEAGTFLERRKAYVYWDRVLDGLEADKKGLDPRPTPHDLRRNFISHLLNDLRTPASVVQALAGHSDVRTTLAFYSRASTQNLADAMAGIK